MVVVGGGAAGGSWESDPLRGLHSRSAYGSHAWSSSGSGGHPASGESAGPHAWDFTGPGAGFGAGVGPPSRCRTRPRSTARCGTGTGAGPLESAPAMAPISTTPRELEAEVTQTSAAPVEAGVASSPEPAVMPESAIRRSVGGRALPGPAAFAGGRTRSRSAASGDGGNRGRCRSGNRNPSGGRAVGDTAGLGGVAARTAASASAGSGGQGSPGGASPGRRARLTRSAPVPAPAPTPGAAAASGADSKVDSQVVTTSADPAAIHAEGSPVKLTEAGHIAARVGDEVITLNELTVAVKEQMTKLPGGYKPNHEEIKMLTSQVLDMLIERSIDQPGGEARAEETRANQAALSVSPTRPGVEEELPPLKRQMGVENEYKLKDKLAEQGKSLERIREIYRQEFLARGFLEQKLKAKISVTVPEMRDYYNAHLDDYNRHELWTWREVVVELDKHPNRAEARSKAEAVLARLRRGEDFAQVAQAESEGPNRTKGGLWETAPDSYAVEAVNEAIRSLPIGQVSPIIEGPTSYHIVRVDARRPAGPASFAEVQDKVRRIVFHRKTAQSRPRLPRKAPQADRRHDDLRQDRFRPLRHSSRGHQRLRRHPSRRLRSLSLSPPVSAPPEA